jgi:hypothetical protein
MTSSSLVRRLEGKTVSALLAELERSKPMYYRLYELSVEPAPGTSCLDALVNAPRAKTVDVLVDGVKKIVPQSLLAVVPPIYP